MREAAVPLYFTPCVWGARASPSAGRGSCVIDLSVVPTTQEGPQECSHCLKSHHHILFSGSLIATPLLRSLYRKRNTSRVAREPLKADDQEAERRGGSSEKREDSCFFFFFPDFYDSLCGLGGSHFHLWAFAFSMMY